MNPGLSLAEGDYRWYILTYGQGGESPEWSSQQSFSVDLPEASQLVNLTQQVERGRPQLTWEGDLDVYEWYNIYMKGPAGKVLDQWYRRSDPAFECVAGQCTFNTDLYLAQGEHQWWVRAWTTAGNGPWNNEPGVFTIDPVVPDPPDPAHVEILDTGIPGYKHYRWEPVAGASWYQALIKRGSTTVHEVWYLHADICTDTRCEITPSLYLVNGDHTLALRSWGPGGTGIWSTPVSFDISAGEPQLAILDTPTGLQTSNNPLFTWQPAAGASWYRLIVKNDAGQTFFDRWIHASGICATTCTLDTDLSLANDDYSAWLQTYGPKGTGPMNTGQGFTVAVPIPAAPTLLGPADGTVFAPGTVSFSWTKEQYTTWQRVQIYDASDRIVLDEWYQNGHVCSASECELQISLPEGHLFWQVKAWSQAGEGPWSAETRSLTILP
ncbi:MAG: hypothetical protein GYB66_10935 [Chloroflexi bacterium]|nr:hypothetical protein [Chloroflexota bacterium]